MLPTAVRKLLTRGILLAAAACLGAGPAPAQRPEPVRTQIGEHLVLEDIPPIPKRIYDEMMPFLNVRSASFADWIPGTDNLLIATRFGEVTQLHVVEQPMGARRQVTFYHDPVYSGRFGRGDDPARFLFTMDESGTEKTQILLHDLRNGQPTALTDGESVNRSPVWSNASARFAFSTTMRNGTDWDVHVKDASHPSSPSLAVLEGSGLWYPLDWSPDDKRLLVKHYISVNESALYVADMGTTATLRRINGDAPERVSHAHARFARVGDGVFFTSDRGSEFQRLYYHDLQHGVSKPLVEDLPWDVSSFALSDDGRLLAFTINENGISRLYLLNTRTLAREQVDVPAGIIGSMGFHPDSERLALTISSATSPGDVHVYHVSDKRLVRWTQSEVGGLPEETFAQAETVSFRTFDKLPDGSNRRIPAFVYRPSGEGPFPVVIDIHGGPESQERPYFDSFRQYLVTRLGVAVIAPNVRGSAGYGKTYLTLDDREKREDAVRDIGGLLDWIATQPEFDESRVAVIGASYGGYMVLASMAHYADRLACGINAVGISNFVTFLESTSDYRREQRRQEYGDERDPEMRALLQSISPTEMSDRITKPLFVVQGANDPRVPRGEAEQIVRAVRENGAEVWYLLALNEGHGLARKENRDVFRAAASMFLAKHLLPVRERPAPEPAPEETPEPTPEPTPNPTPEPATEPAPVVTEAESHNEATTP